MKTRPVFESFSEFVDFLSNRILEGNELPGKMDPDSIWGKYEEIYGKLGKDFDQMMAKWKLAYKKGKLSDTALIEWSAQMGQDYQSTSSWDRAITNSSSLIAKQVQDGKKWSNFEGMSVTVTPFSYENSIGPKVNSTFPLAKKGMINIYETVNVMNTINSASLFEGIRNMISAGRPLEYDKLETDTYKGGQTAKEKKDKVNEDAEKGYWWPVSIRKSFKDDALVTPVVLAGDKSSISPEKWSDKVGSITGLAPKKDQDATKQELTFKCIFYSVDSIELGTGVPRTEIQEKTVEIPIVEKSESNVTKYESVPTPSGLFAAGQAVPVKGKENIVVAALNTIFSQFISVESVEVQGSTSWEWEPEKRNDEKNNALGKARAEYFVKVINAGAGKEIAKIGSTPDFPSNVIQPKDKEKEDLTSWRKVNLKITGTKTETKETPKVIFKVEDEEVVLRRDKINMTEYVVEWTIKSGSKVIKKEGWKN
jgi:hypothetical protein